MDIQQRLQQYLSHKGLNFRGFEEICGLSNGTAARLRLTTRRSTFDRIANKCDLNTEWLLTGEGDMLREAPATDTRPDMLEALEADLTLIEAAAARARAIISTLRNTPKP